jgi:O-antigen ligase
MAESKIFRIIIYILIFAFTGLSNLVPHTGSAVLVLLTLFGLPFCFSSKNRPEITREEKAVMWALTAFFGVYLLSFSINGLLGNLEDPRMKYLDHRVRLLSIIPILFLLKKIQIKEEILWYSVCSGALVTGIYAFISTLWLMPGERVSGSYHSIAFGDLAIVMAFMSLVSIDFFIRKHKTYVFIPLAAFLLGTVASLLSGSKGAWIALPAFALILFFFLGDRMKIWLRISLFLLGCILLFSTYHIPSTGVASRFQAMSKEWSDYKAGIRGPSSIGERMEGWKAAWRIYKQHPLTGAGIGNFKPIVLRMIADGEISDIITKYSQPHNLYLYIMAECGIIGLIAVLGVFIVPLWVMVSYARKAHFRRDIAYGGIILIVGFIHFGLTESIFGRNINISFYVIILAVVLSSFGIHAKGNGLLKTDEN